MRPVQRLGVVLLAVALLITAAALISFTYVSSQTITPNEDFFVVSIGPPPAVDIRNWTLKVDGLVQQNLTLNYTELTSLPNVTEVASLRCVDGPSGRAEWTGVQITRIINMTGPRAGSTKMVFYCADGYSTSLTLSELNRSDILLAWNMNGVTLPDVQGYPVRLVVPEDWGYKWAKFIVHIEVIDYDYLGYWESRGWADNATIAPGSDWYYHAAALSFAAVLGGFSAVSGTRISLEKEKGRRPPLIFGQKYHSWASGIFYLVLFSAFVLWAWRTEDLQGEVFFTFHGRLALLTVLVGVVGFSTGIAKLTNPKRFARLHWISNLTCYVLLIVTIAFGVALAI